MSLLAALSTQCQPNPSALASITPDVHRLTAVDPAPLPPSMRPTSTAPSASDLRRNMIVERLLEAAALRTGLAATRTVPTVALGRARLATIALAKTHRGLGSAADAYTSFLRTLELAPPDFDFLQALSRLVTASAVALYDPDDGGHLYVAQDLTAERQAPALAHEVAHLLHDRHFQLERRLADPRLNHDQRGAVSALIEGAATVLAEELLAVVDDPGSSVSLDEDSVPQGTLGATIEPTWPELMSRSFDATYTDGAELVRALVATGGWAAVHRLLADPPKTTQQLLHPEKLARREPAREIAVPEPPDPSWGLTHADVLGEQTLRGVLEEALAPEAASAAASGWAGDRLALFRHHDGAAALAWRIAFETQSAAQRFALASRELWLSALDAAPGEHGWCRPQRDRGVLAAWQDKDSVLLLGVQVPPRAARQGCDWLFQHWGGASIAIVSLPTPPTRVGTASPVATDPSQSARP